MPSVSSSAILRHHIRVQSHAGCPSLFAGLLFAPRWLLWSVRHLTVPSPVFHPSAAHERTVTFNEQARLMGQLAKPKDRYVPPSEPSGSSSTNHHLAVSGFKQRNVPREVSAPRRPNGMRGRGWRCRHRSGTLIVDNFSHRQCI